MKKPKASDSKGLTPAKGKRRPDGWDPSPVKGKYNINAAKGKTFNRRKV